MPSATWSSPAKTPEKDPTASTRRCSWCLGDAARQVPPCSWGLDGAHVRVADVVGYSCFLRVETLVKPQPVATWRSEYFFSM
jgi:hypothetical protein